MPKDIATLDEAMRLIEILSGRIIFTAEHPMVVLLEEGTHVVRSSWTSSWGNTSQHTLDITRSNITFVGSGINKTIIQGCLLFNSGRNGIIVKSCTFKAGGLICDGNKTCVELLDVSFDHCGLEGLDVGAGASVTATNCEFSHNHKGVVLKNRRTKGHFTDCSFHHNRGYGIHACKGAVVDLHGKATKSQNNNGDGLYAEDYGTKINLHALKLTTISKDNQHDFNTYKSGKIQEMDEEGSVVQVHRSPTQPRNLNPLHPDFFNAPIQYM